MGTIYYGGSETPIHIEDRALAHLKVVIATKLRRRESFTLSWRHPDNQPRGRTTIWLHPSIPLRFVFDDPIAPQLSRPWIEELAHSANSSGGIMLVPEHFETGVITVPANTGPSNTGPSNTVPSTRKPRSTPEVPSPVDDLDPTSESDPAGAVV